MYLHSSLLQAVLTPGSHATETCEPCQVGNEAALNRTFRVPWGCLGRAGYNRNVCGETFEAERAFWFMGI